MGLGDMAKKAKDALSSEKGEQTSDKVLDGAADLANKATGGKHADKIQQGRDAADDRIGTTDTGPTSTTTHGTGGSDGVNAVGNAGGSGHGSGTTAAGAESPGPEESTGRHRA
ncbi:MT0933-like antitoxin protein [Georgenia satyanarayanai]|uniref:MT0933-like antitoxin protein n=1 Tax=Georgenia satyanarayanai TaxID=860221 RepID=A0A2Y9A389_9MICO|nr:antitoxin [Georgenia satyanarayanai]PYG02156.1 antitoxin protein of toxin-antitoxin system [Georgenia satyanarayanai]SSA36969.1 MT0933-like antitoxin protein [Georgenia satyanarayanai]